MMYMESEDRELVLKIVKIVTFGLVVMIAIMATCVAINAGG